MMFCGALELLKVKNVHLKVLFALNIFIRKRKLCFGKTYVSDEPRISKQKWSYRTKKFDAPCFFGSIRRSYLNHASHLNTFRNDLLFAVQGAIQILRSHRGGAGGSRKKQTKAYRGRVELSGQIVRILKDFNDV